MQFEVIFLLVFGYCQAAPNGGLPLLGPGGGGIFKGPDSETIIRGPDGSEITSEQQGGVVLREDTLAAQPIIAAEPQFSVPIATADPILASPVSAVAPLLELEAPISVSAAPAVSTAIDLQPIEIVQQDPHIIETEIIEAPDVEPEQSSDLEGPSGRIITKGSASVVSGPASTTITEPRKIIVAPPKIALPLQTSLPLITASTGVPLPAPENIISSTTALPLDLGYSTGASILGGASTSIGSANLDLGIGGSPLVEYSSSNGVLGHQLVSSTPAPLISSTILSIPAADLVAPSAPLDLSGNIQRIPRIEDTIAANGRLDMDDSLYETRGYKLPHVLSMALSRLYRKAPSKVKDHMVIDDKMGELTQNEISQTDYLGPALAQGGIDPAKINLEQVPLSQVSNFANGPYQPGLESGIGWDNRYKRDNAKN